MDSEAFDSAARKVSALLSAHRETLPEKSAAHSREELFPDFNRAGLAVAMEWERMGCRPVSDKLLQQADCLGASFEHVGLTLGTVLHNVDLCQPLSSDQVAFLRRALLERKVIFFHDQNLTEEQQVAFARNFGDLDRFPFGPSGDSPYILTLDHDDQYPGNQNGWHTDVTWMERPSLGSVAQTVVVPPVGGDTLFSDSYAAYLGLAPDLQERLQHAAGINDYRSFLKTGFPDALPEDLVDELKSRIPFGVSHPILRTHPETGRTALYLHAAFLRHDSLYDTRSGEPFGADESREIVRALVHQHARPEYTCRFKWREGSIAFWDNRAVQHYAVSDYYPYRRVLRRVTISGDRPYYRSESPA